MTAGDIHIERMTVRVAAPRAADGREFGETVARELAGHIPAAAGRLGFVRVRVIASGAEAPRSVARAVADAVTGASR